MKRGLIEDIADRMMKSLYKKPEEGKTKNEERKREPRVFAMPVCTRRSRSKVAKRSDWKAEDMPEQNACFTFEKTFTDDQIKSLMLGNVPQAMEDKWFWYMEGNRLYAHRSWTGYCIFIVDFDWQSNIHTAIFNRDPQQYRSVSEKRDMEFVNDMLDRWGEKDYDYYSEWLNEIVKNIRALQTTDPKE